MFVLCMLLLAANVGAARVEPTINGQLQDQNMCQTCKWSVRILEDALCDPAATDFAVQFVEQHLCPALGDQCVALAEGLIPVAVEWFRAFVSPDQLCSNGGVCPKPGPVLATNPTKTIPKALRDTMNCPICEFVVKEVKTSINPATAEQVAERLLAACAKLPAELVDDCTDFVQQYSTQILTFIETAEPRKVCQLAGLCTAWLAGIEIPPVTPGVVLLSGKLQTVYYSSSNSVCDNCKMAVIEAHSLVTNPSIQADITTYVKQLCTSVTSLPDDCSSYVDTYAPMLFSMLDQLLSSDSLCVQLGVCPPPSWLSTLKSFIPKQPLKVKSVV